MQLDESTICAVSTAPGVGGIAVIRVSGKDALEIVDKVFVPHTTGHNISSAKSHTMRFGKIVDTEGAEIDEVLCAVMKAPRSFTGEDTVEISCHGSQYVQGRILEVLIDGGCRIAGHGEFTQRAYMNGRLDLSQAEAVADLIASKSASAHRMAIRQMKGEFSKALIALRSKLLEFVSLIELELDFGEEDVEFADRDKLKELLFEISQRIKRLKESFKAGNAIKNGIPVAIVGQTNVGKSTLLNMLLGEEKAIVSDIHGTTRDAIEDAINIGGYLFRLTDTAGIRETEDKVESMGIERSVRRMEEADVVLIVVDGTRSADEAGKFAESVRENVRGKCVLYIVNKSDQMEAVAKKEMTDSAPDYATATILLSAKNGDGRETIENALSDYAKSLTETGDDIVISNMRHYEALGKADEALNRVEDGMNAGISGDLISMDLHEVLDALAGITGGEITTDEVLGNIFKNFCIGK